MKDSKVPSPSVDDKAEIRLDAVKRFKKRVLPSLISSVVIMWVIIVILGWGVFDLSTKADYLNKYSKKLEAQLEHSDKKLNKLEEQKAKYEEVQELLQQLETSNIDDMASYIQARYSKVPQELAELVAKTTHDKCIEYGADFATAVGIMEVESAFNPFAVSRADARGLMQVLPKVWMEPLGVTDKTDFHDISLGIDAGIRVYLQYLGEQKGDIKRALNQYNGCSLDKGPYAPQIFEAIGRFTAYRNNSYTGTVDKEQNEHTEETRENDQSSKSVPN